MVYRSAMKSGTLPVMAIAFSLQLSAQDHPFVPMFDGESLSGWVNVNTAPSTWRFEDGLLICSGKPIGEIRTERMYQNFIMEIEWRHMVPRGNAGIFVWADDITARGQPFHRGVEVQVLENDYGNNRSHTTHGDIFPIHGATMDPINGRGGSRAFPTEFRSNPSPQWNHYRITCIDGSISLAVNGKVVTRGENASPSNGYICLESEGGIVHYRNARIRELPDSPIGSENVAIADRGYRSLYNGIDLEGWRADDSWRPSDWNLRFEPEKEPEASPLTSREGFSDYGFLFDVAFPETNSALELQFRGADGAPIRLRPAEDPRLESLLEPQGRWNRVEGRLEGATLRLEINGNLWTLAKFHDASSGPWIFSPQGPMRFANFYVKP